MCVVMFAAVFAAEEDRGLFWKDNGGKNQKINQINQIVLTELVLFVLVKCIPNKAGKLFEPFPSPQCNTTEFPNCRTVLVPSNYNPPGYYCTARLLD